MYSVNGRNTATTATADHAVWALWNPHATQRIKVVSFSMFANAAGTAGWAGRLRRISARGATPSATITPGITQQSTRGVAPASGVLLDLGAFGTEPTSDGTVDSSIRFTFAAVAAAGLVYPIPGGIEIGPGAGLEFIQIPATASVAFDIAVSWLEDW